MGLNTQMSPGTKVSPRPIGLSLQENLENCLNEGKQMTGTVKTTTGAPSVCAMDWISIDWNHVAAQVKQLQVRIAKAVREKRYGNLNSV